MRRVSFNLKAIFIVTSVCALVLSFLVGESVNVGAGALFCCVGSFFAACLLRVSFVDLLEKFRQSYEERGLRPLVSRFRWLVVDTIWGFGIVAIVAVANTVLENSSSRAWLMICLGCPLAAGLAFLWAKPVDNVILHLGKLGRSKSG